MDGGPPARLFELQNALHRHGLDATLTARGLVVRNYHAPGCCIDNPCAADTITCRPRHDDGDRLWFYTSWNHPFAEADPARIPDAALTVRSYLTRDYGWISGPM
ncbi:hypothetical protein Acsp03_24720 [Actinomadura sp. NBRC 104412]|uniref:hypothetical protein n=1 Tax=Actinomadura sp. NBRC 104412 TaxID=3032203 RepID=UPI00249FBD29|nr:hypothetical protein [Actinomadura sp. NBRC 104412]GLZ05006.1 hypothetical protein Acsp03_24720 [Actinomadura sp. NBRC 104412]